MAEPRVMAFGALIAAIREHCPDDQQTRDAIEGLEYLSRLYPTIEDVEREFNARWSGAISEIKEAALDRKLAAATSLTEVREITKQIEDARRTA